MRALLLALAAFALCACNQVYSRAPLIEEAHQAGDPEFRPGLWLISGYADRCDFDIRKRQRDWPDCAVAVEFRRGQMWLTSGHQRLLAQTQRLTEGAPILLQGHWTRDIFSDPRVPEPRDVDNPFYGWVYAAITPTRLDPDGRIREASLVQALCGPPPLHPTGRPPRLASQQPFPGLTVSGDNCIAKDLDTVKKALALSAGLGEPQTMKWVRDDP